MTSSPSHFQDIHRMNQKEDTGAITTSTSDIIRVIEKIAKSDVKEAYVKCDDYEIKVRK